MRTAVDTPKITTSLTEVDGSDVFHRDYPPERAMVVKFASPRDNVTLHVCDIANYHQVVPAESVDVILTDPPYPKEYLPTWEALGYFAEYALKPSGHLLAMSGQAWLPEVFELLGRTTKLRYNWTLNFPMPPSGATGTSTGTSIGRRVIRIGWKPILWYVKPPSDIHQQMIDTLPAATSSDKAHHSWGQPVAPLRWMLAQLKKGEGDVICDPFLGGGTSALAAVREGCSFIGSDVDLECIRTTLHRLNTLQQEIPLE